jgi:predicted neutral ceramidase superfamily lipid hydrolase
MNNVFTSVLAHGFQKSNSSGGLIVFIVMTFFAFGLLIFRKNAKIPKGLFISSLISYVLVSICMLQYFFKLQIPKIIWEPCFVVVFYPNFLTMSVFWALESRNGFFVAAFFVETLVIFGLIRLVLYIRHKISAKKSQAEQTT